MLITCKECELPVSDKAVSCPHCGYPLKPSHSLPRTSTKHMRLPNGFGQISLIKNRNLRNPWRAMVCVGKTPEGRPISKVLKPQGYFKTYNDAYAALVEYNKNPYDLDNDMRLYELYEKWSSEYFNAISSSSVRNITMAWSKCESIKNIMVKEIRTRHIKSVIDEVESQNIKSRIKSMFNLMLDYAVEYELVDKNYARDFKVEGGKTNISHESFTDEEMAKLWANTSIPFVNIILIQCYMGWRPQEMCELKVENIIDGVITGGMKTEAGTDRPVPIHSKIAGLVDRMSVFSDYLVCDGNGKKLSYDQYYKKFKNIMNELGMSSHRPHDPRKHFVTMCKKYNVDEYAIKYMVGHSIDDLTEEVYTDRSIDWLKEEIEKIKA